MMIKVVAMMMFRAFETTQRALMDDSGAIRRSIAPAS